MESYVWVVLLIVIYMTMKWMEPPPKPYVRPEGGLKEVVKTTFVKQNGNKTSFDESIKGKKLIAIYFSAHWCAPCRRFTPVLKHCYETWKKQHKNIEIIFVSHDSDNKSFQDYFQKDHGSWLAAEFGSETITHLKNLFSARGIPKLVVLDENAHLIDGNARDTVSKMNANAINNWLK
eukprot:317376_1